ncbi:MAG: hypothetical protein LBN97_09815, partial [Oscillospiraceae bacterium]|nr:hypothetical protein [Oscillospiraceae bacterium]
MNKIISAVSAQLNIGMSSGTIEAATEQNHKVQLNWEFGGYFPDNFGTTPSMRLAVDNRHIKSWQWENWISYVAISPKPEFLTEVERNLLREGSQNDELIERYATAMLLWDATQSDWKELVMDEAKAEVERVQAELEIAAQPQQYTDMNALIYELDKLRDGDYGEITTINIDGHEVGIEWLELPLDVSDYTAELIIDGERINKHQFSEFLRQSGSFDEYTELTALELGTLQGGENDERLQDILMMNKSVWQEYSGLWYDEVMERVEEELTERGIIRIEENTTIPEPEISQQEGVQMDKTSLDFALNMLREGYFGRITTANINGHNVGVEWSGTLLYGGDYSADLTIDGVVAAEYIWSDFLRYAGDFGEHTAAEGFKEYTNFSENELEAFREGVYGANLAAALDKNGEVWGKTSQQWRDEVMSLIEANLTERGIIPAIKSEVFAEYADMIESIMPLVDEGDPHTVFIISKAADVWTVEYPHLPDDVPVFVANTRLTDPLATSFTGAYFARGSYPYVYDKVLSIRLLVEYYEIREDTINLDTLAELHALAHFTDDVMSELSSETTDFLATLDKPLEWLAGINPYSLKSEAEYYEAPRDTPHKLIDIIEQKAAEAIEARDSETSEQRDYVWNVEIDKINGQAKCRLWDSSDALGALVYYRTVNSTDRSVIEADIREFSPQGTQILYVGDDTAKKQFTTRNLLALKMQIPTEYQQSVVNALEAGNPQAQRLIDLITEVH